MLQFLCQNIPRTDLTLFSSNCLATILAEPNSESVTFPDIQELISKWFFLQNQIGKPNNCTVDLFRSFLLIVLLHHLVKRSMTHTAFICYQHHWTVKICWHHNACYVCVLYQPASKLCVPVNCCISFSGFPQGSVEAWICFDVARWSAVPAGSCRASLPLRTTLSSQLRSVWNHGERGHK